MPLLVNLMGQAMNNLKDIEGLSNLIDGLALNKVQATKLNRAAGNAMRRVVRANLRAQKDISGNLFYPRKKSPNAWKRLGREALNRKMFRTASRSLLQDARAEGVTIGYTQRAGKILRIHNFGESVKFKRRRDPRTYKQTRYVQYMMPKREFLGWSDAMVQEVRDSIINEYSKLQGAH